MERRDFLKLASMAGLGVAVGNIPFMRGAKAAEPYTGPLWIMLHAGGGWDVTSFCDPKGASSPDEMDPMNNYLASEIKSAGPGGVIKYAPPQNVGGPTDLFFTTHGDKILVINGIDCATNSHDVGTRVTWSGTLMENRPSFAALVAGAAAPDQPMAFISNGGYDSTAGVVAATRVGNIDAIRRIAFPHLIDPTYDPNQTPFYSDATRQRLLETRQARHTAQMDRQNLPRVKASMNMLYTARIGQDDLKRLTDFLPDNQTLNSLSNLQRQVAIALAAYQAGICVSANLSIGGFDTHGNNDDQQFNQLDALCDGVNYLIAEATNKGIYQNLVGVMGSDFGRTPGYNDQQGKDHWSITSMIMFGKGITGGRVIGSTDPRHNPNTIDPATLAPSPTGIRITPGHVHKALRKLAGIDTSDVVKGFALKEDEDLPLFT